MLRKMCVVAAGAIVAGAVAVAGCSSSRGLEELGTAEQSSSAQVVPAVTSVPAASVAAPTTGDGAMECRDFLVMGQADRDRVVSQVAVSRNEARVLNPAWRGNVEFFCGQHLDWNVGEVVDAVAGKESPSASVRATAAATENSDEQEFWQKVIGVGDGSDG